jgi:hypothetical protein
MKRGSSRVIALCAMLICVLLACKRKGGTSTESLSDRAAKLQPDAKRRLEQVAALAPKVKAEVAVTTDKPVDTKLSRKAVAIVGDDFLTDPNRRLPKEGLRFENTLLSLCKHQTVDAPDDEDDVAYLEQCVALKTVAVIRQRSLQLPKVNMKSGTYDSGRLEADVLVYELETAELIGAYRILVGNDPELRLPGANHSEQDWTRMAVSDLEGNAETKVEEKLGIKL